MFLYFIFGLTFIGMISFFKDDGTSTMTKKKEFKIMLIIFMFLSLIEGLRAYTVGTDTFGYVEEYKLGYFTNYEPLIKLIFETLHYISSNPTFMLLIMAFLINGLILYAIFKDSCNIRQSLFVFVFMLFYFVSFNALRQALAYALVLNAFVSAKNKNLFLFLLFFIPAIFIHNSALIGIFYIVIFLIKKEDNTKTIEKQCNKIKKYKIFNKSLQIIVTIILTVFIYLYLNTIINTLIRFFPSYQKYLIGDYAYFSNVSGGISRPIIYSAIYICFVLVTCDGYEKKIYSFPLMICVGMAFTAYKIAYLERFMYYFDIVCVLAVPYMLNNNYFNNKSKVIFKIIVCCLILAYGIYMLSYGFMRVKDYAFFWTM